ncbi:MAG: protein kinase [Pirellulales bacterium]
MKRPCSTAMLEAVLEGNMPADHEASLQRHLEECDECSAALERLAGGAAWCQEAAALLAHDELDADVPARNDWSDVDFTVEHLEPSDDPTVLGRLGGYDVLEIIGRGGMGVVLKAFDRELKRTIAIKVLSPHLAQGSLARKRFAREAQAAAAVVHPNVLAIHQVQASGRLPFLVMPLVAGESLAGRLAAQGTLELREILRIGMQAATGLAAAHEQGLVHRDVKPANILLEKGVERAVLTDFGLARAADDVSLTRCGIIAGTPQYMSPEQARGEPLDGRSDLFSLGCVLYEMATGVSPFRADSLMATMRRLVDDAPQSMAALNPELPPWFIAIVERLLAKDPSRRFGSAAEVSDLLGECLAHVQQPASVPLPSAIADSASRRSGRPPFFRRKGPLTMLGAFGIGLFAIMWQLAGPPEIAGEWTGEEWGRVVLNKVNDGEYKGTYTDTFGPRPGEIELRWSRLERRFNGTWREGEDRFGEVSIRLAGDEIRGANTTDVRSRINPGTPKLVDFTWRRPAPAAAAPTGNAADYTIWRAPPPDFGQVIERTIPYHQAIDFRSGRVLEWPAEWRNMGSIKEERWIVDTGVAASHQDGGLIGHGTVATPATASFDDTSVERVLAAVEKLNLGEHSLSPTMKADPAYPGTFFFKTREDVVGVLKIRSASENSAGVRIVYKLVQNRQTGAGEFKFTVPFEIGAATFPHGDSIVIEDVNGTADSIKPGNQYEIKGRYRLLSQERAQLSVYITDDRTDPAARQFRSAYTAKQSKIVTRGDGRFTLVLPMLHGGKPHVSFYPEKGGEGFGGVYFGTGDTVLKKGWWENPRQDLPDTPPVAATMLPQTTGTNTTIARLVLVFAQGQSTRSLPAVVVDAASQTLVVTTGPATIVPEGTPPAVDRAFLSFPGRPAVDVKYMSESDDDLFVYRGERGLTGYRPDDQVTLVVGDVLSAILPGSPAEFVISPNVARVSGLDRQSNTKLPNRQVTYQNLIEIDRTLPEGTPLFKDGKLAGLTLLGSRFVGDAAKISYVVPVSRIAEFCSRLELAAKERDSQAAEPR